MYALPLLTLFFFLFKSMSYYKIMYFLLQTKNHPSALMKGKLRGAMAGSNAIPSWDIFFSENN